MIWINRNMPYIPSQMLFPLSDGSNQLNRQGANRIRTEHDNWPLLPDLGANSRIQVDQPDLAAPNSQ
jgi:hypothetical protein